MLQALSERPKSAETDQMRGQLEALLSARSPFLQVCLCIILHVCVCVRACRSRMHACHSHLNACACVQAGVCAPYALPLDTDTDAGYVQSGTQRCVLRFRMCVRLTCFRRRCVCVCVHACVYLRACVLDACAVCFYVRLCVLVLGCVRVCVRLCSRHRRGSCSVRITRCVHCECACVCVCVCVHACMCLLYVCVATVV